MIAIPKARKNPVLYIIVVALVLISATALIVKLTSNANALSAGDWVAGNIVDDSIFYDNNQMSAAAIQGWLNTNLSCDTDGTKTSENGGGTDYNRDGRVSRAEWARSQGYTGKFVCLRDYYENPTTKQNNLITGVIPSGAISGAEIIKRAADDFKINPKVLLVKLRKESPGPLTSDEWPWPAQFDAALGYACPDPPAGQPVVCDPAYKGFYNQITYGARGLRNYVTYASSYRYKPFQNNAIQFNPNTGCGSTQVYIANYATAGLYNYTPYQPNQAALNNLYGTGDNCSAYGNRNFWTMYSSMFGSTRGGVNYSYSLESKDFYSDASMQNSLTSSPTVAPGSTFYAQIRIKNTGNQTWGKDSLRLGGQDPRERSSDFATDGWLSPTRVGTMQENTVAPGDIATFRFKMRAPAAMEMRYESFGVLIEGQRWLDGFFTIPINVQTSAPYYAVKNVSFNVYSDSARTKQLNASNISAFVGSKLYIRAVVKNIGNQPLPANTTKLATSKPQDRIAVYNDESWINQNRVTTAKEGVIAPNANATFEFSMTPPAAAQPRTIEQFGILIEGQRWLTDDAGALSIQSNIRPPSELSTNQSLEIGNSLLSYDERFSLVLQGDGNLVLYSPTRALWSSSTVGKGATRLVLQDDGNLVLYRADWTSVWNSRTNGKGGGKLIPQTDGNLVLYTNSWSPTWYTSTGGQ